MDDENLFSQHLDGVKPLKQVDRAKLRSILLQRLTSAKLRLAIINRILTIILSDLFLTTMLIW